jgi:hypothetical protein
MQRLETDSFEFQIPADWTYFVDGTRLVCQGPNTEELILNVATVRSSDGAVSDQHVDVVEENARRTIKRMLADPELETLAPLHSDPSAAVRCELALSCTRDGRLLFSQMIFRGEGAVMFATLETPNEPAHETLLRQFVSGVRDQKQWPAV